MYEEEDDEEYEYKYITDFELLMDKAIEAVLYLMWITKSQYAICKYCEAHGCHPEGLYMEDNITVEVNMNYKPHYKGEYFLLHITGEVIGSYVKTSRFDLLDPAAFPLN